LLGATHRAFTFYLGNPISSILNIVFILSKTSVLFVIFVVGLIGV